ncbi:tRNA (adenine(22)-N(1))-methyltransferase [Lentibacillus saliphilus]|uniref:tRNA (adenine(22)-N(1))-methyltransferase n=1 Tax=Lentibacillus saliphilus TaxID=2737028 RepID=UPI001C2F4BC0|nr:tRNA (adenine(22)-N(1))-methyltransferase TrmK [Lentibacillus saliphilus]
MKQSVNISQRLERIAKWLPAGAHFVDVGSDHAYLPCYVCQHDPTARAVAGELNEGPFEAAQRTVKRFNLENVIEVRRGNGFDVVNQNDVKEAVIAGMGGGLIASILERGQDKLQGLSRVIAQPNVGAHLVRRTLMIHGFEIVHEDIIEEQGHIYEMIVADRTGRQSTLDEKSMLFGPILSKTKPAAFRKKWAYEQSKLEMIIEQMQQASETDMDKIEQFKQRVAWIEEVLQDD